MKLDLGWWIFLGMTGMFVIGFTIGRFT